MTDKDLYRRLNDLIDEFVEQQQNEDDEYPETATDAVLLIGTQFVEHSGDRGGRLLMFPRDGSQPYYITQGLLHAGMNAIDTCGERS